MIIKNKTIITNKDWFSCHLMGDFHIGSDACDLNKIDSASNYLGTKKKDEAGVFLVGDLIENVVVGSKGSHMDLSISDPSKQMEHASNYIKKFKHLLIGAVEGNHELRTRQRTGQYLTKCILDQVYGDKTDEVYMGIYGIINVQFQDHKGKKLQKYKIFITHGNGNSGSTSGKINKIHALRDRADADIYMQGHLHQKLGVADYIVKDDVIRKRIFACCSSYLFDAEYAQMFGFRPTDYGIQTININTKKPEMIGYF